MKRSNLVTKITYRPAWWLPGAHLKTLWGKFFRRAPRIPTSTVRWETPDDDFLDVVRMAPASGAPDAPRLVFLHGLEGTVRSHYVGGLFDQARRRGWGADLLLFRSCGGEPNRARRFYHSGETTDLDLVVRRIAAERPGRPLVLAGVSLGGNVLLKWLGERGTDVPEAVRAAAAVSVPYDLERGSRHMERGFSRVYTWNFVRSLVRKVRDKLARYPDLCAADVPSRVRTLYDFDDLVTAPVHGFADAHDYYSRSSSIHSLARIRVPTLLLSAVDDPFLPPEVLDDVRRAAGGNPRLTIEFVDRGGHVGFVGGRNPFRPVYWAEWRVGEFLEERLRSERFTSSRTAPRSS